MKKIFFTTLPYILFALCALGIFAFTTGCFYLIGIGLCVAANVAPTSGILIYSLLLGGCAATIFIIEEM